MKPSSQNPNLGWSKGLLPGSAAAPLGGFLVAHGEGGSSGGAPDQSGALAGGEAGEEGWTASGGVPGGQGGGGGSGGGSEEGAGGEEDDEVLLLKMRAGDTGALSRLWRRYAALLYTQAHAVLHNPVESEDVVAEMFVEVWQRVGNYHPERARPVAWLVTLVRRRAIDKLRERRSYESAGARMARECLLAKQCGGGADGAVGESALEQMRLAELRVLLEGALGQLPQNQRETVCMVYFLGLTQKEIAARTRTPLGTVKTRLELGLRKMRERIRGARLRSILRGREGP